MLDMDDCHAFLLEGYPANIEQSKAFEEEVTILVFPRIYEVSRTRYKADSYA